MGAWQKKADLLTRSSRVAVGAVAVAGAAA